MNGTTTSFVYDRDRLQKSTVSNAGGGVSSYHNDPFGRLVTITSGGAVVGRYVYDGFDRIVEQRTGTGAAVKTTRSTFDAWDRVATRTDANGKTTAFSYLGLSSQLLAELDKDAGRQKAAYTFDAHGLGLTQTSEMADGMSEDAWYGYGPRGDVEALTTAAGETKSTYGYTAYGKDRAGAMTGVDKPGVSTEPYNLYRFGAKRWDSASGDYDMGFRTYNPGLNRFTSRDMYIGALADLNLGTDPWNTNRYTFGGGNPVSRVELDGHVNECLSCGGGGGDASVLAAVQSDGQTTAEPEPEPAPDKPGLFGRAVSRVSKVAETVKDYQGGIGAQAWDTVKGVGQLQSANIDCLANGDCRQQTAMVTTLVTNPTTVVTATIDPVRNDWKEGNHARAAGRVAFMLGEAITAKGLSKLGTATTSTAAKITGKTPQVLRVGDVKLSGVPKGAVGTPTQTGKGLGYSIPRGTPELDPRVVGVRVMNPVTTGKYQYPNGYAVYMNRSGQTINPITGETISNSHPFAHIPLP